MRKDVREFISKCQVCQQMKDMALKPAGLLQPLPVPELVFEAISMDFITGLPNSKGKSIIMVVVDRLSKYGHFIALSALVTSESVATVFIAEVVRHHGVPISIITDRDPKFLNNFWTEIHRLQGTTLSPSTSYHPQTDGQTEVLNKILEMYLRCFVGDVPSSWSSLLPWAEFWYNTSYQTSAQMTPFEVLYGRPPPSITRYIRGTTSNALVETQMVQRDELLLQLKRNLARSQDRMKKICGQTTT